MHLAAQLQEALDSDAIDVSDEEILAAAAEAAEKDPKKRFSGASVRPILAARAGRPWIAIRGKSLEFRLIDLTKGATRKIVQAASRGFFQFIKTTKGVGVEFRNSSKGAFDIILNGEHVGEIVVSTGDFKNGSTTQREKVYDVSIDIEGRDFTGSRSPGSFDTLTAAKKWVQDALSR